MAATSRPPVRLGEVMVGRELSWLDFNDRVLQLAGDPEMPPWPRGRNPIAHFS